MKVIFASISQDHHSRLKTITLAPYALKSYIDKYVTWVETEVYNFYWDEKPDDIANQINGADVYCLSVYLWNVKEILEVARLIKKRNPLTVIALGGCHVSPRAIDVLKNYSWIDIVATTDDAGGYIVSRILEALRDNIPYDDIPGIAFRRGVYIYQNQSNFIKILDTDVYRSQKPVPNNGDSYIATVETYRGCPYDCGYCAWCRFDSITFYPLADLFGELKEVYENPNVSEVEFGDADFFLDEKRCVEIIRYIKTLKSNAVTYFEVNARNITSKLITEASSLEGVQFILSPQSAHIPTLEMIGKNRDRPEVFREKVSMIRRISPEAKITTAIILGLPGETYDSYLYSLDFCLSLHPSKINIGFPLYLLPGSRFYENRRKLGLCYTNGEVTAVTSTPDMLRSSMMMALRLSCYIQLLIVYYPEIREHLYSSRIPRYIDEIRRWSINLERKLNLMPEDDLSDDILSSVRLWNDWKYNFLLRGTENPKLIYDAIGLRSKKPFSVFKYK